MLVRHGDAASRRMGGRRGVNSPPHIIRNEGIWDYLPSCTTNFQPFPWLSIANAAYANTDNYNSTLGMYILFGGARRDY